jgi:hypothetical protein
MMTLTFVLLLMWICGMFLNPNWVVFGATLVSRKWLCNLLPVLHYWIPGVVLGLQLSYLFK